jgi:hypothetical protein
MAEGRLQIEKSGNKIVLVIWNWGLEFIWDL